MDSLRKLVRELGGVRGGGWSGGVRILPHVLVLVRVLVLPPRGFPRSAYSRLFSASSVRLLPDSLSAFLVESPL